MRKRVYYTMVGSIDFYAEDDEDAILKFEDISWEDDVMIKNLDLECGAEFGHVEDVDDED